jgi:hypothetical protein
MFRRQHASRRTPEAPSSGARTRFTYANVTGSLALFVALGGTAAAAVTLPVDSVGSPQIKPDAVRSNEIRSEAVRSSEIRDAGINAADISSKAQTHLLPEVRVAENVNTSIATCEGNDLSVCPDHVKLSLGDAPIAAEPLPTVPGGRLVTPPQIEEPGRNWLVQAKMYVIHETTDLFPADNSCALVNTEKRGRTNASLLDEVVFDAPPGEQQHEGIALMAVVKKGAKNPTIAVRCTRQPGDFVAPIQTKLTATEVGTVTGP